ncbi:MAG TPA: MBL fold metallo-hydrolase [Candidatus Angelobacter sp.]
MLGVGHGDAFLVQALSDGSETPAFTCLIDGGESPERLQEALHRNLVGDIDLLVVSHFDHDHIGGLTTIADDRKVRTYWGPCLPAFARHEWLFGKDIWRGIEKGRVLEQSLAAQGTTIVYPLEGFASKPLTGFALHLLSPPARLIRTLLTSDDVEWLFTQIPTPLGWLAEPPAREVEQPLNFLRLDERLLSLALTPAELDWIKSSPSKPDEKALHRELSGEVEPEFFGDSVLNNTSLVMWIELTTPIRPYTALFTGDQENWSYLLMRHPLGLQTDILKAPHHGGQLRTEGYFSNEEIFGTIRPRLLLVSANGRHGLPHNDLRSTAARWGATICCTSKRQLEVVFGAEEAPPSCHKAYDCDGSEDVRVEIDGKGIRTLSPACHSGYATHVGPIIQIRQHHIENSPVAGRLYEHELLRHIDWLKKKLRQLHEERVHSMAEGASSTPVRGDQIAAMARAEGRHVLAINLSTVLKQGRERRSFWIETDRYSDSDFKAYCLPDQSEVSELISRLRKKILLLFAIEKEKPFQDRQSLMGELDTNSVAAFCDLALHFPAAMFKEAFWPEVMQDLLNNWHCYRHPSGAVGFSQASPRRLYRKLFSTMLLPCERERWNGKDFTWQVIDTKNQLSVPLLVPIEKEGRTYSSRSEAWTHYWLKIDYADDFTNITHDNKPTAPKALASALTKIW